MWHKSFVLSSRSFHSEQSHLLRQLMQHFKFWAENLCRFGLGRLAIGGELSIALGRQS